MNGPVTPDRSDLIVGTMRPPAWVGRVPRVAWLFIALAIADIAFRVTSFGFNTVNGDVVSLGLHAVALGQPAAIVLLPAAAAVARAEDGASRRVRFLFLGTVLLALAELIRVGAQVAEPVVSRVAAEAAFGGTPALDLYTMVAVVSGFVALGGIALVAVGVRALTDPRGGSSRNVVPIAIVCIAALAAFADLWVLAGYVATAGSDSSPFFQPTEFVAYGVGIAERFGWGIVAALAVIGWIRARLLRSGARGWAPMAVGTTLVVLSGVGSAAWDDVVFGMTVGPGDQQLRDVYFAVSYAISFARLTGLVLILVGLARGLQRRAHSESTERGHVAAD